MTSNKLTLGLVIQRLLIYGFLTGFALIMIFPFMYMMSTSLKSSNDVFRFPPQLLPLTPETVDFEGQERVLYWLEVDGERRQMILSGERLPHIFFSTLDDVNPDNRRASVVTVALPRDSSLEEGIAIPTGEALILTSARDREESFAEFEILLDGQTVILYEVYRGSMDRFIDPFEPEISVFAFERGTPRVEFVDFRFSNYDNVFSLNLDRALLNTTLVTMAVVLGQLVTSIFGGYAFSRVRFKGRDTIFLVYLGSIMVPFVVLIIPMYRLMVILEWQNRLVSLILPWIFTAYGTFLMRQFFISIPKEIEEAALLDGASRFRILWGIFVPLSKPAIATLAIFSFLYAWNSFLWPLLIIGEGNDSNHVLTLALIRLSNSFADQPNIVLTGAAIAILPPIILFIFAQRYFIEGVSTSGLKG